MEAQTVARRMVTYRMEAQTIARRMVTYRMETQTIARRMVAYRMEAQTIARQMVTYRMKTQTIALGMTLECLLMTEPNKAKANLDPVTVFAALSSPTRWRLMQMM